MSESSLEKKFSKKKLIKVYTHKKIGVTGLLRASKRKKIGRALKKLTKKEVALLVWTDGLL